MVCYVVNVNWYRKVGRFYRDVIVIVLREELGF